MFAYCNNNPVTSVDYSGALPLYFDFGWENPRRKKDDNKNEKVPGTVSVGIAIFGSPEFWEYGTQFGFSSDMSGNTEFQITGESGLTTGSGFAAMIYVMVTNAPDVSNLQGFGTAVGGVVPAPPVAIGIDYNIIPDPANETVYTGITLAMGSGTAEGHVMLGNTWGSKPSFSLLTVMNNVYNSLAFGMNRGSL